MRKSVCIAQSLAAYNFSCRSYCSTASSHAYDNVSPFKTNKQLADYLCDNILYDKNGIIVVNKPFGICFSRDAPQWKKEEVVSKNVIRHKTAEFIDYYKPAILNDGDKINLHDALPFIKTNLNCKSLCIIRSPEKYTSGVSILGTSEKVRLKLQKCWERSKSERIPNELYLAICSGVPIKTDISNLKIAITLDISANGKHKKAILTNNYTRAALLRSDVKIASVNSRLLSYNNNMASFIELECNQKKWHFVRLFLASHLLSPAIGDHMFGSRVKQIMGTNVPVNHWNIYSSQTQKLNSDLLKLLDLQPGSEKYIPSMIHLSQVKLIRCFNRSEDLILSAPPPSYFNWTLDKLGLQLQSRISSNINEDSILEETSAVNN